MPSFYLRLVGSDTLAQSLYSASVGVSVKLIISIDHWLHAQERGAVAGCSHPHRHIWTGIVNPASAGPRAGHLLRTAALPS